MLLTSLHRKDRGKPAGGDGQRFHWQARTHTTHASKTDSEAPVSRTSDGYGEREAATLMRCAQWEHEISLILSSPPCLL